MIKKMIGALKQISPTFEFEPFATVIQPIIQDVLAEYKKDKYRKGTILTPLLMVWLVLALTLRRDFNYPKTLNWMISGFRWLHLDLPARLIQDGAISHARVKLGVEIFRTIFYRFVWSFIPISPDFHQWITVMFDGTTLTMPDTKSNTEKFGKPKSKGGYGAFPQMRVVSLMVKSARVIFDIAHAPYSGKKTGERTLMLKILERIKRKNFLFLFDAGFYSFFSCLVYERYGI
jgi:hypothetical protein